LLTNVRSHLSFGLIMSASLKSSFGFFYRSSLVFVFCYACGHFPLCRWWALMPRQQWTSSSVASTRTRAWEKQDFLVSACTPMTLPDENWSTVCKEASRCIFYWWDYYFLKILGATFPTTKLPHNVCRFVTLSPNGSRPLRSSTLASLKTPGLSASRIRTGRGSPRGRKNPNRFFLFCREWVIFSDIFQNLYSCRDTPARGRQISQCPLFRWRSQVQMQNKKLFVCVGSGKLDRVTHSAHYVQNGTSQKQASPPK